MAATVAIAVTISISTVAVTIATSVSMLPLISAGCRPGHGEAGRFGGIRADLPITMLIIQDAFIITAITPLCIRTA